MANDKVITCTLMFNDMEPALIVIAMQNDIWTRIEF